MSDTKKAPTRAGPLTETLGVFQQRVGKKAAGRELDGRTWDEVPS